MANSSAPGRWNEDGLRMAPCGPRPERPPPATRRIPARHPAGHIRHQHLGHGGVYLTASSNWAQLFLLLVNPKILTAALNQSLAGEFASASRYGIMHRACCPCLLAQHYPGTSFTSHCRTTRLFTHLPNHHPTQSPLSGHQVDAAVRGQWLCGILRGRHSANDWPRRPSSGSYVPQY